MVLRRFSYVANNFREIFRGSKGAKKVMKLEWQSRSAILKTNYKFKRLLVQTIVLSGAPGSADLLERNSLKGLISFQQLINKFCLLINKTQL